MANRSYKQRLSVQGTDLTIEDLRWLVDKTKDWVDKSRVLITHTNADRPGEHDYSTIEVVGDERV